MRLLFIVLSYIWASVSYAGTILNYVSFEKDIFSLTEIEGSCAEICLYYAITNCPEYKDCSYDSIVSGLKFKYGSRPYNMLQLKNFLEDYGLDVKVKQHLIKEDIFQYSRENMILYFPPTKGSKLGHFSFVFAKNTGEIYIVDPALNPNSLMKFDIKSKFFKRWEGIFFIIESKSNKNTI